MKANYRKSYAYCYATSPHAVELGYGKTGCYYIGRETLREDGNYSPMEVWPGSHGEACGAWKDSEALRSLYDEIDAPVSPYCLSKRGIL